MTRMHSTIHTLLATLALITLGSLSLAGPLDPPPGPITSSYKTLVEVEPRTLINATNTPGDADSSFRITQPGSYYLGGNIAGVANKHGIKIAASNVSVDLNGFEVVGVGGTAAFDGITTSGTLTGITVRNGTSRSWGRNGVSFYQSSTSEATVENVRVTSTASVGIIVGINSRIAGCTVSSAGSSGIRVLGGGTVERCIALNCTFAGVSVDSGCTVSDCTATGNGTLGIGAGACSITNCSARLNSGTGISVSSEGAIIGCSASGNTNGISGGVGASIVNCIANSNTATGISVNDGGSIINCTTRGNSTENIRCADGCLVRGNSCFSNSAALSATNLRITGGENRIEDNTCTGGTRGFKVELAGNILIGNTARNNTLNWDIVTGNVCLVVQAATSGAISGNSGGVSPGSTNPFANFTY